jgi:hypothetical protein
MDPREGLDLSNAGISGGPGACRSVEPYRIKKISFIPKGRRSKTVAFVFCFAAFVAVPNHRERSAKDKDFPGMPFLRKAARQAAGDG